MKFADYLAMSVSGQREEDIPTRKGNPNPIGWKARKIQAEERYRRVMGDQWMTTRDIEKKLGMAFSTARYFLMSRFAAGQMERRKAGPVDSWARSKGYEWRWSQKTNDES